MKIKMKETKKGSPDGVQINEYQKRRTYDLPDSLANAFVRAGWASVVKSEKPPEAEVIEPPEAEDEEPEEDKEEEEPPELEPISSTSKKDKK